VTEESTAIVTGIHGTATEPRVTRVRVL
jgi:hypothetical protein